MIASAIEKTVEQHVRRDQVTNGQGIEAARQPSADLRRFRQASSVPNQRSTAFL
jgi:hypothetical protein